jgi:two-component system, LuxR family, sensor kinase FixL
LAMITDITERKRAEDRLRFILEAANVGTWDWDMSNGTIHWSDNMEAVHHLSADAFDGTFEGFLQDIAPEDRERVQEAIAAATEHGTQYHVEYRLAGSQRPVRWVEGKGRVTFDERGRPVRMGGICTEITERKRLEERFRLAVEASPSAAVMVNSRGQITLVNTQTESLFGYRREELIGRSIELLVPHRFRDRHPEYRDEFFTAPRARPMGGGRDLYGLHKDGREIPVEIGLNPIDTADGMFVLSSIVDITERKRSEQALREVNEDLRETNLELEQFVYTFSHDLKSPLVTTMGFVGLLKEDIAAGRTDEVEDSIARIERAAHRMSALIEDLLQLSRVRRMRYQLEEIDVSNVLREIVEDLAGRLQSAGVRLEIQEDLPRVVADRGRVMEVFENLLINAIKYGRRPDEAPVVAVGAETTDDGVEFFVSDNGPGIDPKYHERIFGLFQRLDNKQEGTGIGLTIVAKIMQVHGGRVWVESQPGDGATFRVLFPNEKGIFVTENPSS